MEKLKFAFATNDGELFINEHFGDADFYDIYEISADKTQFVKRIHNTSEEEDEEIHADPKKAKSIVDLLKTENVKVVCSKVFGPNIMRIKKKFVCVLLNNKNIQDSILTVQANINNIIDELEKGENRSFINLKKISD